MKNMHSDIEVKQIANLFWMGKLTQYEISCIESFLNKGFETILWTYAPINTYRGQLDKEIKIKNAEEIVPKSYLNKFKQNNQKNNLSSFSNYFRYKLLTLKGGWWFDTDCYCLRNVNDFRQLANNKEIVIGKTKDGLINGSVIYLNDKQLLNDLIKIIENKLVVKDYNFYWGEIGPYLLTDYFENNETILPPDTFYQINPDEFQKIFDPRKKKSILVQRNLEDSYVLHFWNEMLRRYLINKSKLPPKNSYIYKLIFKNQSSNIKKQYSYFMYLRFKIPFNYFFKVVSRIKIMVKNLN